MKPPFTACSRLDQADYMVYLSTGNPSWRYIPKAEARNACHMQGYCPSMTTHESSTRVGSSGRTKLSVKRRADACFRSSTWTVRSDEPRGVRTKKPLQPSDAGGCLTHTWQNHQGWNLNICIFARYAMGVCSGPTCSVGTTDQGPHGCPVQAGTERRNSVTGMCRP